MEYMEHSNFYAMCDKIRKMEARELHLALEAHGGEFVWINDENDEEELYIIYGDGGACHSLCPGAGDKHKRNHRTEGER